MSAFIGIDPDSTHTAVCVIDAGRVALLQGGGARHDGRALCTATGAGELLRAWPGARVAVERQTRGLWTESCEGVALVHGIWKGACELSRAPYTGVLPTQWQAPWLRLAPVREGQGGSGKPYHRAARFHLPGLAANEDQAAALGIAAWLAQLSGDPVSLDSLRRS